MKEYKNTGYCIFCGNGEIQKLKSSKVQTLESIFIKPLTMRCPVCEICKIKHLEPAMKKHPLLF